MRWIAGILVCAALPFGAVLAQEAEKAEGAPPQEAQRIATAAAAGGEAGEAAAEEADEGEEVVCRTEKMTGTLVRRRRTCLTRNQWRDIEARTRDALISTGREAAGGAMCRQDAMGGC